MPTPQFEVSADMVTGRILKELFETDQAAEQKISQMKGQAWISFGGFEINPVHIVVIRKKDLTPTPE